MQTRNQQLIAGDRSTSRFHALRSALAGRAALVAALALSVLGASAAPPPLLSSEYLNPTYADVTNAQVAPSWWAITNGVTNIYYYTNLAGCAFFSGFTSSNNPAGGPRAVTNGGNTNLVIRESRIAEPIVGIIANFQLGDVLTPPGNADLSVAPVLDFLGGPTSAVWVTYAEQLIASDMGVVQATWTLLGGGEQTLVYTLSPNPTKRPVRLYWTEGQNAGPGISFASTYRVDIFYNSQIRDTNDVWIANNILHAQVGSRGRFLLTYSRLDEQTQERRLLAYEIVEVLEPMSALQSATVGERLMPQSRPYGNSDLVAEITRGVLDPSGQETPFVYQHTQGAKKGWVWAVRETAAPWQIEIYWKAKEELDVLWPFEVDIYDVKWGSSGQTYIRGRVDQSEYDPRVYFPNELVVEVMPHQEPESHAFFAEGVFYTTGFGDCLLKYTHQDDVWFEHVHSISYLDPAVNRSNTTWAVAKELRPVVPGTRNSLEEIYGKGPAYIFRPSGVVYNTYKYDYPATYMDPGEVESYVFAVNKGTLELWWGNLSRQENLPKPVFFPSLVNRYTCDWPIQAKEIVIASGVGNEGYTLNIDNTGCAYFDHSGMPLELAQLKVCHLCLATPNNLELLGKMTVELWINPANLVGIQYLVDKGTNYRLRLNNGVPEINVGGRWYSMASPLTAGVWQHLAVTVEDRDTVVFYKDGLVVRSLSCEGWLTVDTAPLRIGARANQPEAPEDFFSGYLDEVRIWSVKRSPDEIRDHMIVAVDAAAPGLRANYRFEPDELLGMGYFSDSSYFLNNMPLPPKGVTPVIPGIRQIESGVDLAGIDIELYIQNDRQRDGFNPNEEHALVIGNTAFALRSDLNRTNGTPDYYTSDPFVLLDCRKEDVNGGRPYMMAFRVVPSNELYRFEQYLNAGLMIQPPTPIKLMMPSNCSSNRQISGPTYRDRKGYYWAKQAGDDGYATNYVFDFYYPMQSDFNFPALTVQPPAGAQIPWLTGLTTNNTPIDFTYIVEWPSNVPSLFIGDTLTVARDGLPAIRGQLSVDVAYQQSLALDPAKPSVKLIDPTVARKAALTELPPTMKTYRDVRTGCWFFSDLPPALRSRLYYNPMAEVDQELQLIGQYRERTDGHNYLMLNTLTGSNRAACINEAVIAGISGPAGDPWRDAIGDLPEEVVALANDVVPFDSLALPTVGLGGGYVTVVFNNSSNTAMVDPSENIDMTVFRVETNLYRGRLDVILSENPLDKQMNVYYTADFQGHPERWEFKWEYASPQDGLAPDESSGSWLDYGAGSGPGRNNITIGDAGAFGLSDHYMRCAYRALDPDVQAVVGTNWSPFTPPVLCEGWIKRVLKAVNPFEQRIRDLMNYEVSTELSMIQQIGAPYDGDVPLNYEALNEYGLMQIYETINRQADDLSVNVEPIVDDNLALALLMVKGRICDLYMTLGNEAYGDALNSTILLGENDPVADGDATSLFCFQNQYPDLLSEELALLRGRDDHLNPAVTEYPIYNRLPWNITADIVGGQVAYMLNYGISDLKGDQDGVLDADDAKALYPQGHGDAYGYYLSALKGYYAYMHHPNFSWYPQAEGIVVGETEVSVSFMHEKRFAMAAAARARAGASVIDRTWRAAYREGETWEVMRDSDTNRAWGVGEWASRVGMGAYFDWLTGNSLVQYEETDSSRQGIQIIDRQNMPELAEIADLGRRIQEKADFADAGMNPLGLAPNAVPFDISSAGIDEGKTHFEQIYERALGALRNAAAIYKRVVNCSQAIRDQNESADLDATVQAEEARITRQLIELYGYPYADDIGPGKLYPQGYDGPDLLHYLYVDTWPLSPELDTATREKTFVLTNYVYAIATNPVSLTSKQLNWLNYATGWLLGSSTGAQNFDVVSAAYQGDSVITAKVNVANNGVPVKPATYTGKRRAEGEIQLAVSEYLTAFADLYGTLGDLQNASEEMKRAGESWLATQEYLVAKRQATLDAQAAIRGYNVIIKTIGAALSLAKALDDNTRTMQETVIVALPKVLGLANDALSGPRGALKAVSSVQHILTLIGEVVARGSIIFLEGQVQTVKDNLERDLLGLDIQDEGYQKGLEILNLMDEQLNLVHSVEGQLQRVETARMRLTKVISAADQLQIERERIRMNWASDLNTRRYRNMAYRLFLNDELVRFDQAFDLAARYTFLAAKAYDYETGLLDGGFEYPAGAEFMRQIVKARALGHFSAGSGGTVGDPLVGGSVGDPGLADIMARMNANWSVLEGRLNFNNPQQETGRFSLRAELFRISPEPASDANWQAALAARKVPNLRNLPEFQRFCLPFDPMEDEEPAIVIPFSTTIEFRKNFFRHILAAGDNAYDSSHFATKVRSTGIWFANYDALATNGLANQPRVYLFPAGADQMRVPLGATGRVRTWSVADQALPLPYPINDLDWSQPDWSVLKNSLGNELYVIRRFPSMLAYHDGGLTDPLLQVTWNSRLIGRSVWNSRWLLVIPGGTLLADAEEGLNRFIYGKLLPGGGRDGNGVKDIKIYFHTYSYSGN